MYGSVRPPLVPATLVATELDQATSFEVLARGLGNWAVPDPTRICRCGLEPCAHNIGARLAILGSYATYDRIRVNADAHHPSIQPRHRTMERLCNIRQSLSDDSAPFSSSLPDYEPLPRELAEIVTAEIVDLVDSHSQMIESLIKSFRPVAHDLAGAILELANLMDDATETDHAISGFTLVVAIQEVCLSRIVRHGIAYRDCIQELNHPLPTTLASSTHLCPGPGCDDHIDVDYEVDKPLPILLVNRGGRQGHTAVYYRPIDYARPRSPAPISPPPVSPPGSWLFSSFDVPPPLPFGADTDWYDLVASLRQIYHHGTVAPERKAKMNAHEAWRLLAQAAVRLPHRLWPRGPVDSPRFPV